ncbi:MAG TPA: serine/threonine-protein kinase [Gemmatimonadaceae bacterium]|nr:serine/threonine-protein kinase [Gemmatimonadaceae bacterium]
MSIEEPNAYEVTHELPSHLRRWELPPGWSWGAEGLAGQYRHYQEIIDALGRSLSLVSAPDPEHAPWLEAEARHLAQRNHPAIPTTYHYWAAFEESRRGPGYLRRWIAGETIGQHLRRAGPDDVPAALRLMREVGSTLSYLHDSGTVHGCISPEIVWMAPMGRLWIIGWQWAIPAAEIPAQLHPGFEFMPVPAEWGAGEWVPTPLTDQWQLAAICFSMLTGETATAEDRPPIQLLRPDCPQSVASVIDRALSSDPAARFSSIASMLRAVDRVVGSRTVIMLAGDEPPVTSDESEEVRVRWALADDYEVLASLGAGSFGSVWRVRDLTLGREVALKLLHPHIARDEREVARFRGEARLAAQLAHPAIVPIFDWDSRGDVSWYTMELEESGSVADLIARSGPRPVAEIAPQVDFVLSGLAAAHAVGIVHRDLKPENILIDRYRRWRIADFGIARPAGEHTGTSGTPAFAAPEQLLGEPQDAAVDCFSLAAIVAFVLSGKAPFGEDEARAILARELRRELDLSAYPAEIADWLRRGLSADAAERFGDAATMQAAWREAVQTLYEREHRMPWWRRWRSGDTAGLAWTGEAT